jgi:hypothetical protein
VISRKYGIVPKSFFWCALSIAPPFFPNQVGDTGLGWGKGGGYTECAQKNGLARFHIFLKSPMFEKLISFLRKLVSFRKYIEQTCPTDEFGSQVG